MITGLLIALTCGGLWSADHLIRPVSAPGDGAWQAHVVVGMLAGSLAAEAHAAEPEPPAVVRKKLPARPPAAVPPAAPATPSAAPAPEKAEAVPGQKETAPPIAAETPQKPESPAVAAPAALPAAPAPAAPAPPPVPGTPAEAPAKPEPAATMAPVAQPAVKAPVLPVPVPAKPAGTAAKPQSVAAAPPQKAAPVVKPPPAAGAAQGARQTHAFSILLSSHRAQENALATLPQHRRTGLSPYIVRSEVGKKGVWWRTLAGSFTTLQAALTAIHTLKLEDAVVVRTPFANLVGEFPTSQEAAQAAERLSKKGLHPYVLKGAANSVRLVLGGFADSQAAERYRQELEAGGVTTQVIKR
jgi:septal ring-binding cell division protein DamX